MKQLWLWFAYLPPATKLGQGNVLAGVCDSVNGGGCLVGGGSAPRGLHSPGGGVPGVATAASGTHPTGMHSCFKFEDF